jgi:hypothetical protein
MKLRGSIDLVERHVKSDLLRVTDHKTGRSPWPEPRYVGKGEVLQPLLYALAAEKTLGKPVKSGVLFYCTQRGNYKSVEIQLNAESRKWIRQVIRTIDNAIQQGTLPAAPRKYACRICDYQAVSPLKRADGFASPRCHGALGQALRKPCRHSKVPLMSRNHQRLDQHEGQLGGRTHHSLLHLAIYCRRQWTISPGSAH